MVLKICSCNFRQKKLRGDKESVPVLSGGYFGGPNYGNLESLFPVEVVPLVVVG